jgi:uncharacterized protein (DUF1330 family)
MSVYIIADIVVKDQSAYSELQNLVSPILKKYGGRYLVHGGEIISSEEEWGLSRIHIIEFPSAAKAREYFTSDDYAPITAIRYKAAETRSFMVEGV